MISEDNKNFIGTSIEELRPKTISLIKSRKTYNTTNITIEKDHYCAYCGKKIDPYVVIHFYDKDDEYYHCDCADACKELEIIADESNINQKINLLMEMLDDRQKEMPVKKYIVKQVIQKI